MSLESYISSFEIAGAPGNVVAGSKIDLKAVPTDRIDFPFTEVVSTPVDLQLVLRHLQVPLPEGERPWPNDAVVPALAGVTSGLSLKPDTDKVEAWAGTLSGLVPVAVREIRLEYRWTFAYEKKGVPVSAGIVVVGGDASSPAVSIVVPPAFTEMTTSEFTSELEALQAPENLATLPTLRVSFTVTAWVATEKRAEFTTPPIPIPVVPIPLPSVAALFRDWNLGGNAVLIMVPANSPIGSAQALNDVLSPLRTTLETVQTAAAVTGWAVGANGLLDTVDGLINAIPIKNVAFRARNQYDDLGHDNFIERNNWFDTDIEDRGSSALILSARQAISFFQHDDFGGQQLALVAVPDATLSRLAGAIVRNLHVAQPQSVPPGCVVQSGSPNNNWGDKISSYRWTAPPA